jgi:hypothetical protein
MIPSRSAEDSDERKPGLRVLLVDDDAAFGAAMAKALRRRGFEVVVLDNGTDAVVALARGDEPTRRCSTCACPTWTASKCCAARPGAGCRWWCSPATAPCPTRSRPCGSGPIRSSPSRSMRPISRRCCARPPAPRRGLHPGGPRARATAAPRAHRRLADADEPILLTGETGTGKEVAARALHARSQRAAEPFRGGQHGVPAR